MTKNEQQTIANIVARLKDQNFGCSHTLGPESEVAALNEKGIEAASRLYMDSWVIPALEMLLPGDSRNPELAVRLSAR